MLNDCIKNLNEIPISEDHLKFMLAKIINDNHKCVKIFLEFPLPLKNSKLENYKKLMQKKDNDLIYIDIVVFSNDKYYPIEIKYKTKSTGVSINVFGENIDFDLKQQSASTLAKYYFWKDIYRLQELKKIENVEKGFQLFLTNDESYLKKSNKVNQFKHFSVDNEREVKNQKLYWLDKDNEINDPFKDIYKKKTFYKLPGFKIEHTIKLNWKQLKIENCDFNFLLVEFTSVHLK